MSIKIGNTLTNLNNFTTKERISLSSVEESNLLIMQSQLNNVNISFTGNDTNNFTIGKSTNIFKITQNNVPIVSFSLASNVFYSPTYLNNTLTIGDSINISSVISAKELNTKLIKLTPDVSSTLVGSNYIFASNTNGLLLSANTNGFVNIIGNLNIGRISSNPQYSLMVDNNVSIGNILNVPTINTTSLSTTNIINNRITGKNNTNAFIDFGSGNNNQSLEFNSFTSGQLISTKLTGNLNVTGIIYAQSVQSRSADTNFIILNISSNITTPSETITNTPNIKQPTLLINHTNYSNNDIVDINLFSYTSNYTTNTTIINRVDALTVDAIGRVKIGTTINTNALLSVQTTLNNALVTSNLFTLIGNDSNNSIVYINNTGDVGIGTTNPTSRLHIIQSYENTSSNKPLIALHAQTYSRSNYVTGSKTFLISDLIAGYSNNSNVFYVNSTGDITGNSFTTSNSISSYIVNTSLINANNLYKTISFNNSSISNINTINANYINTNFINTSNTITTSNLITRSISTTNFFIPNLDIFNDKGYYAVYTQQLWFTGSNIVMSSLNTDRQANASQGKLVVRTDDQIIVGSGNAVGLNAIGTKQSSIRVTSTLQPNYELFGPNTTTYIGATKSDNTSGQNMFYISHLLNQTLGNNVTDNLSRAQFRMYATNSTNGISGGTILENLVHINKSGSGNVGIGIATPLNTLHINGSFLTSNVKPILYANTDTGIIRVGVGTTNVLTQLDVMGSIYARTTSGAGGTIGNIYTDGSIGIGLPYTGSFLANLHVVGSGYFTNNIGISIIPSTSYKLNVNGDTNITRYLYASNIGIGIISPSRFDLDVNGTANFRSNVIMKNLTVIDKISGSITSADKVTSGDQPLITSLNTVTIRDLNVTNVINGTFNLTSITQVGTLRSLNVSTNISASNIFTSNVTIYNTLFTSNISPINTTITIGNQRTNTFISGNAIIGQNTTLNTSNAVLYVNGIGSFSSNVNIRGRLITFGNIGSISDKTIKTDLIQINSPLDKIDKLTGYTYIRTDIKTNEYSERETGLIAQDVNEVLPEAVYKNVDYDNLLTISYGNMAGLWVEAFKEMRAEINALKQKIAVLEQKIS